LASSPPEPGGACPISSHWLAALPPQPPQAELGPLQLAWLGDAVWELHQRLQHCHSPGRAHDKHRAVVAAVRATAQAEVLQQLEPLLQPGERELVRRARNRAGQGPRRGDARSYGLATGFEALLGWLFLHDPPRLLELLDHLKENVP
jgi:ribonuclease-3 family protein